MAGKVRFLLERDGRYFARLVVPKSLRGVIGKTELRKALGGDRRTALRLLPGAVTELQMQIGNAERQLRNKAEPPRYPMAPAQMAVAHYEDRLAFDDELRNYPGYSTVMVDDVLVHRLRAAIAGRSNDTELQDLVGFELDRFRRAGNFDAAPGSEQWRIVARALCSAELEALARAVERDEGDFLGVPNAAVLTEAMPVEEPHKKVSLKGLWKDYVASRQIVGRMKDGGARQDPVIASLRKHVGHDDAAKLTKADIIAWRDHTLQTVSATTVSNIYLSTVRSVLKWACEHDHLPENVAANVRQAKPKKQRTRSPGFSDKEAVRILKASRSYQPNVDQHGYQREKGWLVDAKRWVPLLGAFTGARSSELTQLRKEDVREENGVWFIRISPEAGTLKSGDYRDVPLHDQVIAEGFIDFVEAKADGPLFHGGKKQDEYARKAVRITNQIGTWLRTNDLCPAGVQPSHGWRHRLKSQAIELQIAQRVIDGLQGHVGVTASDGYGDVSLAAKRDAIMRLPTYDLAA